MAWEALCQPDMAFCRSLRTLFLYKSALSLSFCLSSVFRALFLSSPLRWLEMLLCWPQKSLFRPTKGPLQPTKGPFKQQRALISAYKDSSTAWGALCWPGRQFVRLRGLFVGLKRPSFGLRRPFGICFYVGRKGPRDGLKEPSFGTSRPLSAQEGITSTREGPVLL